MGQVYSRKRVPGNMVGPSERPRQMVPCDDAEHSVTNVRYKQSHNCQDGRWSEGADAAEAVVFWECRAVIGGEKSIESIIWSG